MAVVTTGLTLPGARSEFLRTYDDTNGSSHYLEFATRIVSNKDGEKYRWLGSLPTMKEWGTGREAKGLFKESYDVDNLKYELTMEVDRDEIADDQTGRLIVRIRQLATRAAEHKDALIATLLANGDQAGYLAYGGLTTRSTMY